MKELLIIRCRQGPRLSCSLFVIRGTAMLSNKIRFVFIYFHMNLDFCCSNSLYNIEYFYFLSFYLTTSIKVLNIPDLTSLTLVCRYYQDVTVMMKPKIGQNKGWSAGKKGDNLTHLVTHIFPPGSHEHLNVKFLKVLFWQAGSLEMA